MEEARKLIFGNFRGNQMEFEMNRYSHIDRTYGIHDNDMVLISIL